MIFVLRTLPLFRISALIPMLKIRSWHKIGADTGPIVTLASPRTERVRRHSQWRYLYKARIIPSLPSLVSSDCQLSFVFLQNHQKISWVKSWQHDFHVSFLRKSLTMTMSSCCGLRKTCWQDKNKISFNVLLGRWTNTKDQGKYAKKQ